MSDGEPAAKTAKHEPGEEEESIIAAVNLAPGLGIAIGGRLEVLWDVETGADIDSGKPPQRVWWPCTVLELSDGGVDLVIDDSGAEQLVVLHRVRYDAIAAFPEWTTDEELTACVAFVDEHMLFSTEEGQGYHEFRAAGSDWEPSEEEEEVEGAEDAEIAVAGTADALSPASGGQATGIPGEEDLVFAAGTSSVVIAAAVVEQLMEKTIIPAYTRAQGKLDFGNSMKVAAFLAKAREVMKTAIAAQIDRLPPGVSFGPEHVADLLGGLFATLNTVWREASGRTGDSLL